MKRLLAGMLCLSVISAWCELPSRNQRASVGGTRYGTRAAKRGNYVLNPYVYVTPLTPVSPMGSYASEAYSDYDYSRLILSTIENQNQPLTVRSDVRSIAADVQETPGQLCATRIMDVLDRGVLITETREELRMRGLRFATDRNGGEVRRYYAREAVKKLREVVQHKPVYLAFSDPLRDKDGTLIANVYLEDGTDLNRLMLELGYGTFYPDDFSDDAETSYMIRAQEQARKARRGLWSGKNP